MTKKQTLDYIVIRQDWEESERGWGVRPDGISLHATPKNCQTFIKEYWDSMPDEIPDEYSRPSNEPYPFRVTQKLYALVIRSKNGLRVFRGTNAYQRIQSGDNHPESDKKTEAELRALGRIGMIELD